MCASECLCVCRGRKDIAIITYTVMSDLSFYCVLEDQSEAVLMSDSDIM